MKVNKIGIINEVTGAKVILQGKLLQIGLQ